MNRISILTAAGDAAGALDHEGFGRKPKSLNVIDSNGKEHDLARKVLGTFRHHAPWNAIDLASRTVAKLHRWRNRRRTRLALSDLDDRTLRDIGLTRAEVLASRFRPGRID